MIHAWKNLKALPNYSDTPISNAPPTWPRLSFHDLSELITGSWCQWLPRQACSILGGKTKLFRPNRGNIIVDDGYLQHMDFSIHGHDHAGCERGFRQSKPLQHCEMSGTATIFPDNKVHEANIGPTWVLSSPGGPHVGPMNLAIRVVIFPKTN